MLYLLWNVTAKWDCISLIFYFWNLSSSVSSKWYYISFEMLLSSETLSLQDVSSNWYNESPWYRFPSETYLLDMSYPHSHGSDTVSPWCKFQVRYTYRNVNSKRDIACYVSDLHQVLNSGIGVTTRATSWQSFRWVVSFVLFDFCWSLVVLGSSLIVFLFKKKEENMLL